MNFAYYIVVEFHLGTVSLKVFSINRVGHMPIFYLAD